jgi:tetratricopeptide (TPR) repeat protein
MAAAIAWPRIRERSSASAWERFYAALSNEAYVELERIAEEHPGTAVAHWGLAVAADARLANGCVQLFSDKMSAAQELRKAIEDYTTVIEEAREPELPQRALFGRARAYEAVSGSRQGEAALGKAIADYEEVVEKWPSGTYTPMASRQLKRLKSQDTKVFYDKFAAYAPKRPISNEGEPGRQLPFDSRSLPDNSPSEFSEFLKLDDLKVKGSKATDKTSSSEKPEPGKTPPTASEPAKSVSQKTESSKSGAAKPETPKAELPKPAPEKTEPPTAAPWAPAPAAPAPAKPEAPKK